ncbi:MAG: hypothetical protein ACOCYO_04790 [Bacteroidota bacterium]
MKRNGKFRLGRQEFMLQRNCSFSFWELDDGCYGFAVKNDLLWHPAGVPLVIGSLVFSIGIAPRWGAGANKNLYDGRFPGIDFNITNQIPIAVSPFHNPINPPPPAGANNDSHSNYDAGNGYPVRVQ